jgi:glycosyltransferase involved in cell wall biosynthesis
MTRETATVARSAIRNTIAPTGSARRLDIAALTSGSQVPSTRFRIRQHIASLAANHALHVREYMSLQPTLTLSRLRIRVGRYAPPLALLLRVVDRLPGIVSSHRADVVWVERQLIPGVPWIERCCRSPIVLDVDDALWLARPFGRAAASSAARASATIIVGNSFLAEFYQQFNQSIFIVPTAVDTRRFHPIRRAPDERMFTIGWTGTAENFVYFRQMEEGLSRFLAETPHARLRVLSDSRPQFDWLRHLPVEFIPWSPANEAAVVQSFDVGVMPLTDDENARGKCSFKMLQYLACAVPVVVSPVGMNSQVLSLARCGIGARNPSEWCDALKFLYKDPATRAAMGNAGRAVVEKHFSAEAISPRLAKILRGAV